MRLFLALALCVACALSVHAQGGNLEYVESGITLRMSSPVGENAVRKFVLVMQTNDVYECENTLIENDVRLQGNKLLIKVKGVRIPEPCNPRMGLAKARIDLSSLPMGKYHVRVNVNRQIFKATLEITATHYDFVIPNADPSLFRIYNGRLNIIPSNSIWGLCEYRDPSKKAEVLSFMKALETAGATLTQLPAGNYDDFYLHRPGTTEEKIISAEKYEYPFLYFYTGDFERIKEILNAYRGKLDITFQNSSGLVLKNF